MDGAKVGKGKTVELQGLSNGDLNGVRGRAEEYLHDKERLKVRICDGSAHGREVAIKYANLVLVSPEPSSEQ